MNTEAASLLFRPATSDDLPEIVAMLADDGLGRGREDASQPLRREYADAFAAVSADNNNLLVVAQRDGELVGCMQLTFIPGVSRLGSWRCQIEAVRVAAAARGSGLGRAMIERAIATARERGCRLVQLTSDKGRADAHRFYAKLGFEPSHIGMKLTL